VEAGRGRAGVGLRAFVHDLLSICASCPSSDSYLFLERTYELVSCFLYHVLLVLVFIGLRTHYLLQSRVPKKVLYWASKYPLPTTPDNQSALAPCRNIISRAQGFTDLASSTAPAGS
jgi:hypothetical protein